MKIFVKIGLVLLVLAASLHSVNTQSYALCVGSGASVPGHCGACFPVGDHPSCGSDEMYCICEGDSCDWAECGGAPPPNCCATSPGACGGYDCTDLWCWNHSPTCVVTGFVGPSGTICTTEWQTTDCGATDSCVGGTTLSAGLCSPSGCTIGGAYKQCCDSSGNPEACIGGNYSGTCPTETVFCGWNGYAACGPGACSQEPAPSPDPLTPAPTPPVNPSNDYVAVVTQLFSDNNGNGWRDAGEPIVEDSNFTFRITVGGNVEDFSSANMYWTDGGMVLGGVPYPNTGLFSAPKDTYGATRSCSTSSCEGAGTWSDGGGRCWCHSGQAWSAPWSNATDSNRGINLGRRIGGYHINSRTLSCSFGSSVQLIPPPGWVVTGGLAWQSGTYWRKTDEFNGGSTDRWNGTLRAQHEAWSPTCGVGNDVRLKALMFGVQPEQHSCSVEVMDYADGNIDNRFESLPVQLRVQATNASAGKIARIFINRNDEGLINQPTIIPAPAMSWGPYSPPQNFYNIGQCTVGGDGTCDLPIEIPDLEVNPSGTEYSVHCNIDQSPPTRCSGNPYCNYEQPNTKIDGSQVIDCTGIGFVSCSEFDWDYFTVVPTPTPTPMSLTVRVFQNDSLACSGTNPLTSASGTVTITSSNPAPSPTPATTASFGPSTLHTVDVEGGRLWTYASDTIGLGAPLACSDTYSNVDGTDNGIEDSDSLVDSITLWYAESQSPWWQTVGGDVLANAGVTDSDIPASADANRQYMSLAGSATYGTSTMTSGVMMASGNVSYAPGGSASLASWEVEGAGTQYDTALREDYCYFWDLFEMPGPCDGSGATHDFGSNTVTYPGINITNPDRIVRSITELQAMSPSNNTGQWSSGLKVFFFDAVRGNGGPGQDISLASSTQQLVFDSNLGPIVIPSGEKYVIFVNGATWFNSASGSSGIKQFEVVDGGFLAIIGTGQIRYSDYLGNQTTGVLPDTFGPGDEINSSIDGVFITNNQIWVANVADNGFEKQFVGEGIFVGWGGVHMSRELDELNGNLYPAHVFKYRPDFLINAPDEFKRVRYEWDEIAPRRL